MNYCILSRFTESRTDSKIILFIVQSVLSKKNYAENCVSCFPITVKEMNKSKTGIIASEPFDLRILSTNLGIEIYKPSHEVTKEAILN